MFGHLRDDARRCAFEKIFEHVIVIEVESACLLHVGACPLSLRGLHPVRGRAHHKTKATIGPELLPRTKSLGSHDDRNQLRHANRTKTRSSLEYLGDRMSMRLVHHLGLGSVPHFAE